MFLLKSKLGASVKGTRNYCHVNCDIIFLIERQERNFFLHLESLVEMTGLFCKFCKKIQLI